MSKASAPWEGEKAPEEPKDAKSTEPAPEPEVAPEPKKNAKNAVVGGEQASLALVNLVSRGMSMKDAKAKLDKAHK